MKEEQNWMDDNPRKIYPFRDNNKIEETKKEESKGEKIKKGMQKSVKQIGRPSVITDNMANKAYQLWKKSEITQKEISENWGVSERTVRRKFKKLK